MNMIQWQKPWFFHVHDKRGRLIRTSYHSLTPLTFPIVAEYSRFIGEEVCPAWSATEGRPNMCAEKDEPILKLFAATAEAIVYIESGRILDVHLAETKHGYQWRER